MSIFVAGFIFWGVCVLAAWALVRGGDTRGRSGQWS